ncbi:type IV secretion system protein [Rhizobium beringeri]
MNPFDILFGKIDSMGVTAVESMYSTLAGYLGPLFLAALTIYVVWWGYEMLFGRAQMTAGAFVWRFGRAFICYTLIVSWATYQPLIVDPLLRRPTPWRPSYARRLAGKIAAETAHPSRRSARV